MDALTQILWSAFGLFVFAFIGYALAHAPLVRPFIRMVDQEDRFPFLDVIVPRMADRIADWRYRRTPEGRAFWEQFNREVDEKLAREHPYLFRDRSHRRDRQD